MSDAFDQLCARLETIDLFGKAGAPPPAGHALTQAVIGAASFMPNAFQQSYAAPLQNALPRLVRQASRGGGPAVETLTAAVYQHATGDPLEAPLGRFLAVISDLYDSFLNADKRANIGLGLTETLPPLAMFQYAGDQGPFTLPVDAVAQLIGATVGVVSMPATYADHPVIWAALAHECGGHDVTHADSSLLPELAAGIGAAFAALPDDPSISRDELGQLWAYWIDEATADVYGLLNVGPAFATNLAAFFVALNKQGSGKAGLRSQSGYSSDDPDQMLDPHPTDILRLHLAMGVVDTLSALAPATRAGYIDQLQGLATRLASSTTVQTRGNIRPQGSNLLQPMNATAPLGYMQQAARSVGGYIASAKLTALAGHGIQDIETWDDQDESRAAAIRDALLAGKSIVGLGDDAQLMAGATLALLQDATLYDAVTAALNAGLDDSHRNDPLWGLPPSDPAWMAFAPGIFS